MPRLILHTSNQLDLLAGQLCEVVSGPLDSPFTPELVVVNSLASRRWLTLKIAELHGICANFEFPFFRDCIDQIVRQASKNKQLPDKISTDLLTWKIDSLLPDCLAREEFSPLANYLGNGDSLKQFHLAARIADLFDQYRVYRPELVSGWMDREKKLSADEKWQAILWRELEGTASFEQAFEHLRKNGFGKAASLDLPSRISIFAPTSLPPAYLDFLFQLSRIREVHLFLVRPSRHYRGDDRTKKQRVRGGLTASDAASGNPLATSWGKIDADLTDLLLETEARLGVAADDRDETFEEFNRPTLLDTIKSDILNGENRGAASDDGYEAAPRTAVEDNDRSIELHACHSPMREVEVLYDQLLKCFETIPDLQPRDILVITPEIEKYAPLIEAVFGYPEKESIRIPYSLADRHRRTESLPIDTFLTLLDLPGSRYTASEIFALLGSRCFRRRFRFSDEDLSLIRDWIEDTAIRWGIDAAARELLGLPGLEANTWRHGLERLLLGYAMAGTGKDLFERVLPHSNVEGDGAEVLGRFVTAAEALFSLAEDLERPRPLTDWSRALVQIVDQFLKPDNEDELRDIFFLRLCIDGLQTIEEDAGLKCSVEFRVVRQYLSDRLATMEQQGTLFTGKVTFCALKPARSIPARIVCLLGMNDQVFPRLIQPAQFDLMAKSAKPGDPSPRQDDRYAFLETLLSAGDKLSISYVGRSAVHNKKIIPSIVVSELFEYLNQAFIFPDNKSAKDFLLVEHPLQAFSPRYFSSADSAERLFSYSEANAEASRIIISTDIPELPPFIRSPLPAPDETIRNLDLGELYSFWANPSKYLLRRRLGLSLKNREDFLHDDEPFQLEALERYPVKQELLEEELANNESFPSAAYEARGILPPGAAGVLELRTMQIEAERLATIIREHDAGGARDRPIEIDLALSNVRLSGMVRSIYRGRAVYFRMAKLNPRDHLRAWIEHLALCAQEPGKNRSTILIGRDAVVTFRQAKAAPNLLETLCAYYYKGLVAPLPFFPASAFAFAQAEEERSQSKAKEQWYGPYWKKGKQEGEKDDLYISRCFDVPDPLDDQFRKLAGLIFDPLFEHAERQELSR